MAHLSWQQWKLEWIDFLLEDVMKPQVLTKLRKVDWNLLRLATVLQ